MDRFPFLFSNGFVTILEQHPHWPALRQVHDTLQAKGYRALLAGGAVRDLLLSRFPKDLDLATNATPEQVEALFDKTIMVGKAFGVVRVIIEGVDIEVATFRKDGPYQDGRRPQMVQFSSEKEDALRRDFTINALFYDLSEKKVLDYVDGERDIRSGVIRTVGSPQLRFEEDKLRILRALRFHAQLGFALSTETQEVIPTFANQLVQVSQERLRDEWQKLLTAPFAMKGVKLCYELSLWPILFPNWVYQETVFEKFLDPKFCNSFERAWAVWINLQDLKGEKQVRESCHHWKLSGDVIDKVVSSYLALQGTLAFSQGEPVDWALNLSQKHNFFALDIFEYLKEDELSQSYYEAKARALQYFNRGELPRPLVHGEDLIQLGHKPGTSFKKILEKCYRQQLLLGLKEKKQILPLIEDLT